MPHQRTVMLINDALGVVNSNFGVKPPRGWAKATDERA